MDPAPPTEGSQAPPPHIAGAYGFSRNELRALVIFGLLAGGWITYQWFDRRSSGQVPPWVVEDVTIGSLLPADSTLPNAGISRARISRSASRGQRYDASDPGHVLTDINTAGRGELIRLPGIGLALAARIIADREKNGPFTSLLDFQRVRGIGPKTASMLAGWVKFSRNDIPVSDTSGQVP